MGWCVCGGHKCPCGKDLEEKGGNCTHVISEMLFQLGYMTHSNSSWMVKCDNWETNNYKRPIRASQMKKWFKENFRSVDKPEAGKNYFIWTNSGRSGHVYYGTKDKCVHGTGAYSHSEIEYYEP